MIAAHGTALIDRKCSKLAGICCKTYQTSLLVSAPPQRVFISVNAGTVAIRTIPMWAAQNKTKQTHKKRSARWSRFGLEGLQGFTEKSTRDKLQPDGGYGRCPFESLGRTTSLERQGRGRRHADCAAIFSHLSQKQRKAGTSLSLTSLGQTRPRSAGWQTNTLLSCTCVYVCVPSILYTLTPLLYKLQFLLAVIRTQFRSSIILLHIVIIAMLHICNVPLFH